MQIGHMARERERVDWPGRDMAKRMSNAGMTREMEGESGPADQGEA
jgi:hypothetical protein